MGTKIALVAAIVLGILAAVGVRMYLERTKTDIIGGEKRVTIAVARQTLNKAQELKDSDIRSVDVQATAVTDQHILYDQRKRYLNQPLNRKVTAGRPIMKNYLLAADADFPDTSIRGENMRAMTLGTDQISGVAGLISPGNRVDIIGTFRVPAAGTGGGAQASTKTETKVIARSVEILAVDNRTSNRVPVHAGRRGAQLDSGYSSVTVLVTPQEALVLTFAQNTGKISFAMRRSGDTAMTETRPALVDMQGLDQAIGAADEIRYKNAKKAEQSAKK